jgi:hypothetical protein
MVNYDRHAFLWNGSQMLDLNNLIDPNSGWVLEEAYGINNMGQIAGIGTHNGLQRSFILTPNSTAVPEPGTWALLAGLTAGAGLLVRRHRNR